MKKMFPGYHRKTEQEIRKIWENGIILFDTNVLLNLYRYSDATREALLDLISKFSEQIYLPHQAALEYNRNRCEVIAEQEKAYKEFLEKISQIQKDLQSTNKPPFLTARVDQSLNSVFDKVSQEVQESIQKYSDYLKIDPIYERISELFSGKIAESYSIEELEKIYKEGEERFRLKVPPGFEDEKTKEGNRKYGDLVLWKQVIGLARTSQKDVILVTDERKVDWWWKIKDGRNMGARQELVEELKKEANVEFHMYSSERFLSYGQTFLNEIINQKALDEIQAMKKAELEDFQKMETLRNHIMRKNLRIWNEVNLIEKKIVDIDNKINGLRNFNGNLFIDSTDFSETQEYLKTLSIHQVALEEEKNELLKKLESLKKSKISISDSDNVFNLRYFNYIENNLDETQ